MDRSLPLALCLALASSAAQARPSAPPKSKAASARPAKAPPEALAAAADQIAQKVAALRGLPLKKPLVRGVLSRAQIGKKLEARIAKEYTPAEVRAESRVLKRLGLLPPEVDYAKMLLDLLMEQVAGFYDPYAAKLYIADWLTLEMQRPALAHEIVHALQDQHFGLKRFAEPIKDNGDLQLARSALIEGDATAAMLEFQAQAMGVPADQMSALVAQMSQSLLSGSVGSTPQFDKAPPFVRETLLFPYLSGLLFVDSIHRGQPWSKVDEAFRHPPESTEQILHPEKYATHEHPVKVTATPLAALPEEKELRRDVIGELMFKILFATAPPPSADAAANADKLAERAAAGWGGDRMVAYAAGEGAVTVADLAVWDTEGDAKEAEAVAERLMRKLANADSEHSDWLVRRQGDKLALVFGAPKGSGEKVATELLKEWRVER